MPNQNRRFPRCLGSVWCCFMPRAAVLLAVCLAACGCGTSRNLLVQCRQEKDQLMSQAAEARQRQQTLITQNQQLVERLAESEKALARLHSPPLASTNAWLDTLPSPNTSQPQQQDLSTRPLAWGDAQQTRTLISNVSRGGDSPNSTDRTLARPDDTRGNGSSSADHAPMPNHLPSPPSATNLAPRWRPPVIPQ